MLKKRYAIALFGLSLTLLCAGMVGAKEPNPPNLDKALNSEQEARISRLEKESIKICFEELKQTEFLLNEDFSSKAAYRCFRNRKERAVQYAVDQLKNNPYSVIDERVVFNDDMQVAKTVIRAFSSEAEIVLLNEYKEANLQTKASILLVSGQLPGRGARLLLITALNDQSAYENPFKGMEGEPLRICDMAYNQLRLRYAEELNDMPRTIGNPDRIEKRDYYIDEMKNRF